MSVICVYNDSRKLNKFLVPSLQKQSASFELLTVDNTRGQFGSAPAILNKTAAKAKYKYLMFVHQDVALESDDWLAMAMRTIAALHRFGVAGVAGRGKAGFACSISSGNPSRLVGKKMPHKPVRVQTVDGCLMIVTKRIFESNPFDETTIEGWYFYVMDYCLGLASQGYRTYVLPQRVFHESQGPSDPEIYNKTLQAILAKHRQETGKIYSTMGVWNT